MDDCMASKSLYISEGMLLPNHDTSIFRTEKEMNDKVSQKLRLYPKYDGKAGFQSIEEVCDMLNENLDQLRE